MVSRSKDIFLFLLSIALGLGIWQFLSTSGWVPRTLFPAPTQVMKAFVELVQSGEMWRDVKSSLWRGIAGFTIGVMAGTSVGLLTARIFLVDRLISPILHVVRSLPPVATISLWVLWLGIGPVGKVTAIAYSVSFAAWIATHIGAREVPRSYIWSARSMGCGPFRMLTNVVLPAAAPYILSGARAAAALTFVMIFVSELAGTSSSEGGLGYQIAVSQLSYRIDRMMAALVVLGACGAIMDQLIVRITWWTLPWMRLSSHH